MSRFVECSLCGTSGHEPEDIAIGLVWWASPTNPKRPIEPVLRCRDHAACRKRVMAEGVPWPVQMGKP